MKLNKPPIYELYGFLISMPLISWAMNYILFGNLIYTNLRLWLLSFPLIFVLGYVSWQIHFQYRRWVTMRYPDLNQTGKRVACKLLVFPLVMVPSLLIMMFFYSRFELFDYTFREDDLKMWLLLGLAVNLIFETLWEVIYIIDRYKENLTEKELLQQMNIEQEYENLKTQVNPHFLFNCFNTLLSLIAEDKRGAEKFLDELSKVYRYVLNTNQDDVAALQNEIRFINSYLKLLKTRYGVALQVRMKIDEAYCSFLLPSLSLQLLVENAVKHNVVSRGQPLMIDIFTTPQHELVIKNIMQPRQQKEASTRIGLKNIEAKYKLLGEGRFRVVKDDHYFTVILPLIRDRSDVIPGKCITTVGI